MVRLTRGGWFVAADKDAAAVPQFERRPDRWGDQPPGVSHVEHLRGPALTWIKVVSYRTFGKSVEA